MEVNENEGSVKFQHHVWELENRDQEALMGSHKKLAEEKNQIWCRVLYLYKNPTDLALSEALFGQEEVDN